MGEQTMREALEESFSDDEEQQEEEKLEEPVDSSESEDLNESDPEGKGGDDDEPSPEGDEKKDNDDESVSDNADEEKDEESSKDASSEKAIPAPVSWTPSVRELWAKLPKDVQKEVQKRETEISRGLQQASGFKKVAQEYHSVVQPFESLIRAQNSTPAQAITNFMTTAARLTMGNPVQKAEVIKEIITNYAIDIETLDKVLSGADLPNSEFAPIMEHMDEQMKPMRDFMGQFQTAQDQQTADIDTSVASDISAFATDDKNEFFEDVREDMADIMELASRRNKEMTMPQAYAQACQANPDISKILNQRKAAKVARLSPRDKANKRHASSGVRNSPPAGDGKNSKSNSLRGSLENAFEDMDDNAI